MNTISMNSIAKYTLLSPFKEKNIQELYEKYIRKADEAIMMGDRVLAEKYYQSADHYLRVINEPKAAYSMTSLSSEEIIVACLGNKRTKAGQSSVLNKKKNKNTPSNLDDRGETVPRKSEFPSDGFTP